MIAANVALVAASRPAEAQFRYPELEQHRFDSFYRYQVELVHTPSGEPIRLEVPIGCWTSRDSSTRGSRMRAPYIAGTRIGVTGEAVFVTTPDICGRGLSLADVPADYLPLVLLAPDPKTVASMIGRPPVVPNDAGTIEFLIGYVHEDAYAAPVSHLRFEGVTIEEIGRAAFRDLVRSVSGRAGSGVAIGEDFFRGGGFPDRDVRNLMSLTCHGAFRVPVADSSLPFLRHEQPAGAPPLWLPDVTGIDFILELHGPAIEEAHKRWGKTPPAGGFHTDDLGNGLRRGAGIGDIRNSIGAPGATLGISRTMPLIRTWSYPFVEQTRRVQEGYERTARGGGMTDFPRRRLLLDILDDSSPDTVLLSDDGWDSGFVACYRLLPIEGAVLPQLVVDHYHVGRQAWPLFYEFPVVSGLEHVFKEVRFPLYRLM